MENLLTGYLPLTCKSWRRMRGCYKKVLDHTPPPTWVTLKRIMAERKELYCAVPPPPPPPPGETIPISVLPSSIDDSVPTKEELEGAVRILWENHSGGPSWMRAKHLR